MKLPSWTSNEIKIDFFCVSEACLLWKAPTKVEALKMFQLQTSWGAEEEFLQMDGWTGHKNTEFNHETTVDLFISYFCDFTTSAKVLNLKPMITQEEQTCSGLNISGRREERKDDFTES